MKKSLLIVALALVVAGSLVAGTMAQYVSTVAPDKIVTEFKEFGFSAINQTAQEALILKMAPGDSKTFKFLLSNVGKSSKADAIAETDMAVSLRMDWDNLPTGMKLYVNGSYYDTKNSEKTVAALKGGSRDSSYAYVTATWESSSDDNVWAGANNNSISLSFTASQVIGGIKEVPGFSVTGTRSSNYVTVGFTSPADLNLAIWSNDDARIDYYFMVAGVKVPVKKGNLSDMYKSKWFSGYLCNASNTSYRYGLGYDNDGNTNDLPKGVGVLSSLGSPASGGYGYMSNSWGSQQSGPLFVTVTINKGGTVYQSTAQVAE